SGPSRGADGGRWERRRTTGIIHALRIRTDTTLPGKWGLIKCTGPHAPYGWAGRHATGAAGRAGDCPGDSDGVSDPPETPGGSRRLRGPQAMPAAGYEAAGGQYHSRTRACYPTRDRATAT